MITQAWVWQFENVDGSSTAAPVSPAFPIQFDAEEWLGARWREFAAAGLATARLFFAGAQVGAALDVQGVLEQSALAARQRPTYS